MKKNHWGETSPEAYSLVLPLLSRAVPAPTSVGSHGRDGGVTACSTDSSVRPALPAHTPPASQEVTNPEIGHHRTAFRRGRFSCSWGGMAARDCQGAPEEGQRDRRRLHCSVGLEIRGRVPTRGKVTARLRSRPEAELAGRPLETESWQQGRARPSNAWGNLAPLENRLELISRLRQLTREAWGPAPMARTYCR